jgi:DNA-directed RNA polymerase subunit RPC12/RpoP
MNAAIRRLVRQRADNRCEYCGHRQEWAPVVQFHIDHIVPRKHGGTDQPKNLALACPHCNVARRDNLSGKDPVTGRTVKLFNPRTQSWRDHFELRGAMIVGLTPTGRTTVRVCNMNDDDRLEIRRRLHARGELR